MFVSLLGGFDLRTICCCLLLQPLRLEIKKLLSSRSDRVKCVDIHPTEPWVLSALYNGHVFIWDYQVCKGMHV